MRAYWPTAKEKKKNLRCTASKMRQWYLLNMNGLHGQRKCLIICTL